MIWLILAIGLFVVILVAVLYRFVFLPWGTAWGASPEECAAPMTGDTWCAPEEFRPSRSVRATRALSIAAPPEVVWPWLAQIGRGAGFYAYDRLDNGGRCSARHILTWVTPARIGDATAIGYLRALTPGRELGWWMPADRILGCQARMAVTYRVEPTATGSRLIARISADGRGRIWPMLLAFFFVIDTLMMRHQIIGIRQRAERYGARPADPERPETAARDQFQLYEFIGADGASCGVPGKEKAAHWHKVAAADLGDRMGAEG